MAGQLAGRSFDEELFCYLLPDMHHLFRFSSSTSHSRRCSVAPAKRGDRRVTEELLFKAESPNPTQTPHIQPDIQGKMLGAATPPPSNNLQKT